MQCMTHILSYQRQLKCNDCAVLYFECLHYMHAIDFYIIAKITFLLHFSNIQNLQCLLLTNKTKPTCACAVLYKRISDAGS